MAGAKAYFSYINAQGGVNGRKLRLIAYDDSYDPAKTQACFERLQNDKVFAMGFFVGTPTAVKYVPMAESAKVPLIGDVLVGLPLGTEVSDFVTDHAYEGLDWEHFRAQAGCVAEGFLCADRLFKEYDFTDAPSRFLVIRIYINAISAPSFNDQNTFRLLHCEKSFVKSRDPKSWKRHNSGPRSITQMRTWGTLIQRGQTS